MINGYCDLLYSGCVFITLHFIERNMIGRYTVPELWISSRESITERNCDVKFSERRYFWFHWRKSLKIHASESIENKKFTRAAFVFGQGVGIYIFTILQFYLKKSILFVWRANYSIIVVNHMNLKFTFIAKMQKNNLQIWGKILNDKL